ncbi:hypothetical protein PVK06_008390 [Gossypium arboreum]|uniref:Uncharacterized protein n=1 Tax=Gossypium arboreum TaxID=29729 RepID=A0ABR0QK61_GOSAR|nr:hypothetical protein PVK06_008390 [Gossypium arboreum]
MATLLRKVGIGVQFDIGDLIFGEICQHAEKEGLFKLLSNEVATNERQIKDLKAQNSKPLDMKLDILVRQLR